MIDQLNAVYLEKCLGISIDDMVARGIERNLIVLEE